ncbi:MAG TPA: DUF4191 domain-containing protein [Candidatus Nanopelagicales bacterium]|nr:DUF4191 domain-containing protein [Candidatus Nanopelagicales bacterium]
MSNNAPAPARGGRLAQIRETYKLTRRADPRIGLILVGLFVAVLAVFVVLGLLLKMFWFFLIIGIPFATLAVTFVFGRRAEKAAYAQVEGQPGAAASVLNAMRSGWFTTPAVAVTKNQDFVHRVLGRPGVILVSEAPPSRAPQLLANEKKRTARFVGEIPIYEIQAGDGEGQVPLRKLQGAVMKLPRNLKPAEVNALRKRLDALTATPLPIPKGPLPKGTKIPRA